MRASTRACGTRAFPSRSRVRFMSLRGMAALSDVAMSGSAPPPPPYPSIPHAQACRLASGHKVGRRGDGRGVRANYSPSDRRSSPQSF